MGLSYPVGVAVFGSTNSLVKRDRTEVSALSGGVMLQPLSIPLQNGVRFFRFPLPADPWASLTVSLPLQAGLRAYPVPSKKCEWVRPCLDAGGGVSAYLIQLVRHPATYLLVQA